MGITRVTIWVIGTTNLLTKPPDPPSMRFNEHHGCFRGSSDSCLRTVDPFCEETIIVLITDDGSVRAPTSKIMSPQYMNKPDESDREQIITPNQEAQVEYRVENNLHRDAWG